MIVKTLYLVLIISCIFGGCNKKSENNYYLSIYLKNYELTEIDSLVFYNNDSLFISQTGDMDVWRNYILITDFNFMKLWIFDKQLNLQKTVGRKGRGPGEYVYPPVILKDRDKLYLLNMKFKQANLYDSLFNFVSSFSLPKDIDFPSYKAVSTEKGYVFWGLYPYPISDVNYFTRFKSLIFLNKRFKHSKDILDWDEIYSEGGGYALSNVKVLLSSGDGNSFFALQPASLKIEHIDKNFKTETVFGKKPEFFKRPPNIKFEDIQKSVESATDFSSKTTSFLKMYYDKINKYLLVNYVNLDKDFFYARTLLLGKHYLQVYNKNYDCIYDGPIPGKLAFTMDGKIYILTDERPEFIKFKIFRLVKK